jgi:hypothetical protein
MQKRDVSNSGSGHIDLNLNMTCSLSLHAHVPERSSPSRVRFAAQNRRALDRSGPFRRFTERREREQMQRALSIGALVLPPAGRPRAAARGRVHKTSSANNEFLPGLLADY